MKLTYRGIGYDYTPPKVDLSGTSPLTADTNPVHLSYRGVAYDPSTTDTHATVSHEPLTYRGVTYRNAPVEMSAAPTVVRPVEAAPARETPTAPASVDERARLLMMSHHRQVKQRQQVMLTRLAETIGMPVAEASHYWNHVQGKVHPSFWNTYDRSHVATS